MGYRDRYPPAGFTSVIFEGGSCLSLTIDQSGSTANRPLEDSSAFYDTQGRTRPVAITGLWTLSAKVFVSSAFNTSTGQLVRSDLWGIAGTPLSGGAYMVLGFTNASPADPYNPAAADRTFRFEVFDPNTGYWINIGVPDGFVFDTWHTISGTWTGTAFEYRIDGALVLVISTAGGGDLQDVNIEGYNFSQPGSYTVYWGNLIAAAIPFPVITNSPLTATGTVGAPFSFTITASGSPTSYTASPLPAGLVLNATTGAITGIPTTAGTTSVLLRANNAAGTGNATLTITVAAAGVAPIITNNPLTAAGTVGTPFSFTITASGSPTSYTASPLPAGLGLTLRPVPSRAYRRRRGRRPSCSAPPTPPARATPR